MSLSPWSHSCSAGFTLRGWRSEPSGKPLLHFLHGNGFCGRTYEPMLRLLAEDFDLWLCDIQGHGESDHGGRFHGWNRNAEMAVEAFEAGRGPYGDVQRLACGHSFGGVLSSLVLARHPTLFARAVLLDPVLFTPAMIGVMALSETLGLQLRGSLAKKARLRRSQWPDRAAAYAGLRGRGIFKGWTDEALWAYVEYALKESDGGVELKCRPSREAEIFSSFPRRLWPSLGKITTPTRVLYGDRTYPFVAKSVARWCSLNPRSAPTWWSAATASCRKTRPMPPNAYATFSCPIHERSFRGESGAHPSVPGRMTPQDRAMRPLLFSALLLLSGHTQASEWNDSQAVDKLFGAAGVKGTFVLYDVQRQRYVGHDRERAETRFVPASTYKVANSLIGLSTGAVRSADEVLPYGGKPQRFKAWEHDMSLRDAIKASNVPVYQELARRIGLERMRANVSRLGYGNAEIGQVVDNFWLVGPLKISAMEQTRFLLRLAQGELPFPAPVQSTVRAMTLLESGPGWELHGKTGWCFDCTPELGWWVGWVKRNERLYGFALNIDMPGGEADIGKRVELGKASLKALGILP